MGKVLSGKLSCSGDRPCFLTTKCWQYSFMSYFAERAKATLGQIGPAVFQGGFSTFLAFVLLADSNSYGFALFFRVCVLHVLDPQY